MMTQGMVSLGWITHAWRLELASLHSRTSRDRRSSEQHRILAKTLDNEHSIRILFVILSLSDLSTLFTF